jgi:hypothetical protein
MSFLKKFLLLAGILVFIFSCRKDKEITDPTAKPGFSDDTVMFDTVFTTIGSTTKQLKVYNPFNKSLKISSIYLAGGQASNFRININGQETLSATNIIIRPKDSLYIFITVRVDPNNSYTPFVISDSIVFETNGNIQDVNLVAWGQNAYYHTPDHFYANFPAYSIIDCNSTWTNDKPHVIYGYAVVDSACSLTMQPGTRVYMHNNSVLWVYKDGTLKINGSLADPVKIQGDRLESSYADLPGQWGKIWLSKESKNNVIDYAIIKNGTIGIQVDTLGNSANPTLTLTNTKILNMSGAGIYAQNSKIVANNTVVANCAQYAVALTLGGDYDFRHCTFANYWTYGTRQTPLLLLNNYYEDVYGTTHVYALTNAYFANCIVYGSNDNEIGFDKNSLGPFLFKFDYSLLKIDPAVNTTDINFFEGIIKNSDPTFIDVTLNDYQLQAISPARNAGKLLIPPIPYDIINHYRLFDTPDMGAYEYQP